MILQELRTDQQKRWQGGERVSVDAYLRRYPELKSDPETLSDLILGEMHLRETVGEVAPLDDYLRRFPQCADRLLQRYRADLATAMPGGSSTVNETIAPTLDHVPVSPTVAALPDVTLNAAPSPNMETIQLDEAGQLAAQEKAFQDGVPKVPGYTILSELGRGGMGVVYRARQISAGRDVALKIVRSDVLDTLPLATRNSTLQRFRHEAHAAAKLEHENLVPVYDVGEAGSLRYYAMKFVDGTSLYDMLRNQSMSSPAAAKYIEPIARGLHYAHEQGVLHRDLKPHNIIVERRSGRPMLTDFGLAKFLEQRDELTHVGDVMGTPSYMSPEQARDSGRVGPLADVYSLGATLYHVLTSRPPFQASVTAETLRQVLHEEPVAPRRLNPAIDRDLETICLKCLQKEPAKRYASSLALAEDLRRYLNHEPIVARPAGVVERTWRWCRRNPKLAASIATAVFFAVFTVLSSTIGYVQVKAGKAKSDALLKQALFVVDDLFTKISEDDLLNQPGMQPLRKDLLEKALKHYQYFLSESGNDPTIQDEIAAARFRIGLISNEMGDYEVAARELDAALNLQRRLLQQRPNEPRVIEALGDTLNYLGRIHTRRDEKPAAAKEYAESERLRARLVEREPTNTQWQRKLASIRMNLGLLKIEQGQIDAGRRYIQSAQQRRLAILQKDSGNEVARRDLAMGYFNLGNKEAVQYYKLEEPRPPEKADPAIASLRDATTQFALLSSKDFANRYYTALAFRQLGGLLTRTQKIDEAIEAYESARPLITSLAQGNPDVIEYQTELIGLAMNQGALYIDELDDIPRSQEAWMRARDAITELLKQDSENYNYHYDLAISLDAIAENYGFLKQNSNKVTALESVLSELTRLSELAPDNNTRAEVLEWQRKVRIDLEEARKDLDRASESVTPSSLPAEDAEKNQ